VQEGWNETSVLKKGHRFLLLLSTQSQVVEASCTNSFKTC